MRLDLSVDTESATRTYPWPGNDDVTITLRPLTPHRARAHRKAAGLPAYRPPDERTTDEQEARLADITIDDVLVGWSGFDDGGEEAPCTTAHKRKLVETVPGAFEVVVGLSRRCAREILQQREHAEGNSQGSSHGGSSTSATDASEAA